jgi:UDP-N-acetylglucosamine 2-epimerase (non-hydrolysing)
VRGALVVPLTSLPHIHVTPPRSYLAFVLLLQRARVVLTDSGGVQEEAPALGCPVLMLRQTTERREGIAAGAAQLVGTCADMIVTADRRLLDDAGHHAAMATLRLPYGDGYAADRIATALERRIALTELGTEVAQAR